MNDKKIPLIHLARRKDMSKGAAWAIRGGALLFAFLLGGLIFVMMGNNPIEAYGYIISGSLGKATSLRQTIKIAVPLLGTALALAPCFKMKFWNIGAEGQITMGAIAATFFALNFADKMPSPLLLIVMGLAGAVFGAIWAFIPAVFNAKWSTNETLFTLMMNYIAIGIVKWLQGGPWEGKPGSQIIPNFKQSAVLPKVFGIHIGWIMVLALTVFMFIYMKYSKHGYEISVVGESRNTAKYAGMNVAWITIRTMLLSGAICGLVGYMIVSGANQTLYANAAGGVGFTAITVAWLAQLNPFAMIAISFLLAVLSKGASELQTRLAIPASISDIITGIVLFCMLACEFFIQYKILFRGHENKEVAGK